ncbi:MAG: hypothetical protein D9V46_03195 [Deltaproteobacteria bacterium]|nr:MAG: hypothetical protein D9V46_03195 [Deltaproteobacteria bacterium]
MADLLRLIKHEQPQCFASLLNLPRFMLSGKIVEKPHDIRLINKRERFGAQTRVCKEFCVNGFCDQNSGSLSSNMMLN